MIFNQVDRLIIGALLGPAELGYYSVCAQAAQPIHGLTASGLHFLFPHFSARRATGTPAGFRRVMIIAFWCNAGAAVLLAAPLALFSRQFLSVWMGASFAEHTASLLTLLAIASGFLALNVAPHYTLLALGQVRYVTVLNLVAGAAMLLAMALLIPRFGLLGAALGRLIYGPVTWLMYFKLSSQDNGVAQSIPPAMASVEAR
jgi:O-antigen/teichoic acid export membrane protein